MITQYPVPSGGEYLECGVPGGWSCEFLVLASWFMALNKYTYLNRYYNRHLNRYFNRYLNTYFLKYLEVGDVFALSLYLIIASSSTFLRHSTCHLLQPLRGCGFCGMLFPAGVTAATILRPLRGRALIAHFSLLIADSSHSSLVRHSPDISGRRRRLFDSSTF